MECVIKLKNIIHINYFVISGMIYEICGLNKRIKNALHILVPEYDGRIVLQWILVTKLPIYQPTYIFLFNNKSTCLLNNMRYFPTIKKFTILNFKLS